MLLVIRKGSADEYEPPRKLGPAGPGRRGGLFSCMHEGMVVDGTVEMHVFDRFSTLIKKERKSWGKLQIVVVVLNKLRKHVY